MAGVTSGPDGVKIPITAETSAAEAEIVNKLGAAFAKAMTSKEVLAAWNSMLKSLATEFRKVDTNLQKTFTNATKNARSFTDQLARGMEKVSRASKDAFSANTAKGGAGELRTLNALVDTLSANFRELATDVRTTNTVLKEMGSSARAQLAAVTQESRTQQQALSAALTRENTAAQERQTIRRAESVEFAAQARLQSALVRTTSAERVAEIRRFASIATASIRSLTTIFSTVFRGATSVVRGFVSAAGGAIRGLRSAFSTTFSGISSMVTKFASGFARAFSGLGRGVASAMAGVSRTIASALRRDEDATRQSLSRRERDMQSSATRQRSIFQTAFGAAGLLGGAAGVFSFLTGGFKRAGQEEALQLTFTTLLRDGDKAKALLGQISDYARTTSFDFTEVAGSVAQLTAAFGDADRAFRTTTFLADVVALTGGATEQLGQARLAFSQIASAGRVQGQDLNQLFNALPGIPIAKILTDKFFGGDQAAFAAARASGELGQISADAFFAALEEGVGKAFPGFEGSAERLAGTLSGLAQNLLENIQIFGAQLIRLVQGPIKGFIKTINTVLDAMGRFVSGEMFEPETFRSWTGSWREFTRPLSDAQEKLLLLRDVLGNVAKALGVLLAFKGAFEIFGLIGKGIGLALTPMGLLVVGIAGITAAFTLFNRFSDRFASTWRVVGNQIKPLIDSFKRLWTAISGRFGGGEGGEGVGGGLGGIIRRIGDAFRYVNVWIARGLVWIRQLVEGLGSLIALGREDYIDDFIVDKLFSISDAIANFLGSFVGISKEDIDAKGGGIGGLLRNTFLEPVVDFIVKLPRMLIDAVGGGIDFVGDIIGIIFGGSGGGDGYQKSRPGHTDSAVGRILDRLSTTFLAPVASFFQDGGFQETYSTVRDFVAPIFTTIADALSKAWGVIQPIVQPFLDSVEDLINAIRKLDFGKIDLGNVLMGAGIGAGAGLAVGGLPGLLVGGLLGGLSQTGLFGGLVKTIKNAYEALIRPALEGLWDQIVGGLGSIFSAENIKDKGTWLLDFLERAGNAVGRFATSPEFVAALVAVAGAAVLVVGAFTKGLVEGIATEAFRWAGIFGDAVGKAFKGIGELVDFAPAVSGIFTALGTAISNPTGGAIAIAGTAVIGTTIVKAVIGGITSVAPALVQGAGGLASMIFGGTLKRGKLGVGKDAVGNNKVFSSAGAAVAAAVIGGIASFEVGKVAGESGSVGNIVLGILGGTLTGASLGTAIAPGIGTAIGAALGLGAAALGAFFGTSSRVAAQAKKEIQEYADALGDLRDVTQGGDAATDTILANLRDESANVNSFLVAAKFNARQLADEVLNGDFDLGSTLNDLLNNFLGSPDASQLSSAATGFVEELQNNLNAAIASGKPINIEDILPRGAEAEAAMRELADAGFDVRGAFDAINDESSELFKGVQLQQLAVDLSDTAGSLDTVAEAVSAVNDALGRGDTAEQIAAMLSNPSLDSAEALNALSEAAETVQERISDAKDQFDELLEAMQPSIAGPGKNTIGGITDAIVGDLPEIESRFQGLFDDLELPDNVRNARINLQTADFSDQIADALSQGFTSGAIDTEAERDEFIAGLRTQITDAGLGEATTEMLMGVLDAYAAADFSPAYDAIASALTDKAKLAETGRLIAAGIAASIQPGTIASAAAQHGAAGGRFGAFSNPGYRPDQQMVNITDIFDPNAGSDEGETTGENYMSHISVGAGRSRPQVLSDIKGEITSITAGVTPVAQKQAFILGSTYSSKMGEGMRAGAGAASSAAGQVVQAARLAAGIGAVFMYQAGINLGNALAKGIGQSTAAAVAAARALAAAVTTAAKTKLDIKSPSQVFVDIGKQVGAGFVEGIEASEGSMTQALTKALTTAIDTATEKAAEAINKANVATKLFELLQPSNLPGGTSDLALGTAAANATSSAASFLPDLRSGLADAFGDLGNTALSDAKAAVNGLSLDLSSSFTDLRGQFAEAKKAQGDLAAYSRSLATLRSQLASGQLNTIARDRLKSEAYKDLLDDQQTMNDKIARLRVQLNNGRITADAFNQKVKDLKDSFAATTVDHYNEAIDKINRDFAKHTLGLQEYNEQLDKLGSRPGALSFDQANLLKTGYSTLNVGTIAGRANRETVSDALGKIREFGQAALEAGTPLATVITQMAAYTKKVTDQARAMGLATTDVTALVSAFGLTTTQLNALKASFTSLSTSTVQGATNVQAITDQLTNIRDYAATLLEAGDSTDGVIDKIRTLRDQLVSQATAYGFSAAGVNALVDAAGLSNTALAEFVKQLNDYTAAVKDAAAATAAGTGPGGSAVSRPIGELHVHVPYGDPEAVALSTANRLAFDVVSSW